MADDPCTSRDGRLKKRWARELAAQFVADWYTMKKNKPHGIYDCPACEYWHVTSHPTRQPKRRKQRGRMKP